MNVSDVVRAARTDFTTMDSGHYYGTQREGTLAGSTTISASIAAP